VTGPLDLPISQKASLIVMIVTFPTKLAVISLPIYAFFVLRWWEPIVGILIAAALAGWTRAVIYRSGLPRMLVAMGYSIAFILFASYKLF
jgi:hypothetical protein